MPQTVQHTPVTARQVVDPVPLPIVPMLLCAGDKVATLIIQVLEEYKIEKRVAMLTTDNSSNMVCARNIVVSTAGLEHIIPFRCVFMCAGFWGVLERVGVRRPHGALCRLLCLSCHSQQQQQPVPSA